VVSVIDFGDMHEGFTVGEPAIGTAYAILGKDDPLAAAAAVLAGYHEVLPLKEEEIEAFFPLMAARLAVSVVNTGSCWCRTIPTLQRPKSRRGRRWNGWLRLIRIGRRNIFGLRLARWRRSLAGNLCMDRLRT
jgi:Ser/Thr protein kinase RdoA (MazF antagonist)